MNEIVGRVTTAIFLTIAKKMATDPICPSGEVGRAAIAAMREYLNNYDVEDWPKVFDEAIK